MDKLRAQSTRFGTSIITETITRVDFSTRPFKLWREYNDGVIPIFRNQHLAVIDGGDSAVEEAIFLTKYASKVEILWNTEALETVGDEKLLNGLRIINNKTNKEINLEVKGLFYAIGHTPNTKEFGSQIETFEDGYIKFVPGNSHTNVEGVFAAGDVNLTSTVVKESVDTSGNDKLQVYQVRGLERSLFDTARKREVWPKLSYFLVQNQFKWDTGSEGLVYSEDGTPIQAFTPKVRTEYLLTDRCS